MLPKLTLNPDADFQDPPSRSEIKSAHPWLRCFAKVIDLTLFGFSGLVFSLIVLGSYSTELYDSFVNSKSFLTDLVAHGITMFFWLVMEVQLVYHGINTPGRKLLGLQVEPIYGQNQHPMRRAVSILFQGFGLGIVFFALIAGIWSYTSFLKEGVFPWDRDSGYQVVAQPVNAFRIYFGSVMAIMILSFVVLNYISSLV